VPDLNLCRAGGQEFWIELKADKRPRMRPEQYAWMMRRMTMGGIVVCLNRPPSLGHTWELHDLRTANITLQGTHMVVLSEPNYRGLTTALLDHALEALWNKYRNNSHSPA
jgi:hypothetical protein